MTIQRRWRGRRRCHRQVHAGRWAGESKLANTAPPAILNPPSAIIAPVVAPVVAVTQSPSFICEVCCQGDWSSNGLRFATEAEAGKLSRRFASLPSRPPKNQAVHQKYMNRIATKAIALRHAIVHGDLEMVRKLLQRGVSIDALDNAPLRRALQHQHLEIVRLLLDAGAKLDGYAGEFLRIAAKNGDSACLKILLEFMKIPFQPNALDLALYDAVVSRNLETVTILLQAGANPMADNHRSMGEAALTGSIEIMKVLHQHGGDLFAQDFQPLFNAVVERHAAATKFLLQAGANPNSKMGICSLMAISNGDAETLELLLRAGAKLPTTDLIANAADHDSLEVLFLLVNFGYEYRPYADEIAENAIKNVAPRVLNFILQSSKISRHIINDGLVTVARYAGEIILDILIKHGADASTDKSAALKIALESGEFNIARKLLAANAHVPDLPGTVIHHVIQGNDWPLLVILLQAGIPTDWVILAPIHAVEFFNRLRPWQLLADSAGELLPKKIRVERQKFVKATAIAAGQTTTEGKSVLAQWLTTFLILMQSNGSGPE